MDDPTPDEPPADDATLLRRYRDGSQAAFAAFAGRHVDWIHASAARRLGGDRHRADDVTQAVLFATATRGPVDRSEAAMAAWMFRVLQRAAANVVRSEARRRKHEAIAIALRPAADDAWAEVAPRLDAFVDALPARDREAILLRFYRRRSHEAVGAAMNLSPEGARKRVARAIEKLRDAFARAGVSMPAAALGEALTAHVVTPTSLAIGGGPTAVVRRLARSTMRPIWPLVIGGGVVLGATVAIVAPRHAPIATALSPTEPATRPATITLDELIAGIKRNEAAVRNVHVIDFDTTIRRKKSSDAEWQPTPVMASGEAWYAGGPGGKVRIDFARHVTPWIEGRAPFLEMSHVEAWDGRARREIRLSGTYNGRTTTDNVAILGPERGPWTTDPLSNQYTGVGFSLAFHAEPYASKPGGMADAFESLGAMLERGVREASATRLDVSRAARLAMQDVNGVETVRLSCEPPNATPGTFVNAYWFAPSKGFALVRRVQRVHLARPRVDSVRSIDVTELTEAAPGIWLPRRASAIDDSPGVRGEQQRVDFTARQVIANDPTFDATIFAPLPPANHIVTDTTGPTRRDYVVWRDGSEHEMHRGEAVPFEPRDRRPTTRP